MKKGLLVLAAAAMMIAPVTAAAAMMIAPVTASAARVFVGVGGPAFYGGYYSPFWGGYWGPGYPYYGFPNAGEVKLDTKVKDAQVFIDGAYAGLTKDNKTMHLRPGNYNIEIRENGETAFTEAVSVMAGKTLHLYPAL